MILLEYKLISRIGNDHPKRKVLVSVLSIIKKEGWENVRLYRILDLIATDSDHNAESESI